MPVAASQAASPVAGVTCPALAGLPQDHYSRIHGHGIPLYTDKPAGPPFIFATTAEPIDSRFLGYRLVKN